MNSMNDERFFDLAMKAIARQADDAERSELEALLAREPELRAEFARLQADARITREALPLVKAMETTAGEFPTFARERLQTKVRQTLGRPEAPAKEPDRSIAWGWRWALGLAAAAAAVMLVVWPMSRAPNAPIIQLAMLDTAGVSRGAETSDVAALQAAWRDLTPRVFSTTGELEVWKKNWPDGRQTVAKIIYDRAAAELKVLGKHRGKSFEKTIPVEPDLAAALKEAKSFIAEQTR